MASVIIGYCRGHTAATRREGKWHALTDNYEVEKERGGRRGDDGWWRMLMISSQCISCRFKAIYVKNKVCPPVLYYK